MSTNQGQTNTLADDYIETFTVKLPRRISRWLRVDAESEGRTPEQYIAAAAADHVGAMVDSGPFSKGIQDSWREEAATLNERG